MSSTYGDVMLTAALYIYIYIYIYTLTTGILLVYLKQKNVNKCMQYCIAQKFLIGEILMFCMASS